jgi:hypothetical protein
VLNVNDLPTGAVTITGTATQGQTLSANNTLADIDGIPASGSDAISYQWQAGGVDIAGATGNTFVLGQAQVSKAITVVAVYTDAQGTPESKSSTGTTAVVNVNDLPTGTVTITGTATQGQTLTANNTLTDIDGIPTTGAGAISYQWSAGGVDISGATGNTYVLGQAEVGKIITVVAQYTDAQGTTETVTSSATTNVTNINDAPTGAVTITGTATQGQTLTAANTLTDIDGIPAAGTTGAISYQWQAGGVNISGATGSTLVLGQAHVAQAITVVAQYTDAQGTTESVASVATTSVDPILPIGLNVDVIAYSWNGHTLLSGVSVTVGAVPVTHVTDASGRATLVDINDPVLSLTVARAVPDTEAAATGSAVNLQDAIAILKMIVGLDVNGAGKDLSPYQTMAADFDGNGTVGLTDAIGVLKHVVGLSAPEPTWYFANEVNPNVPGKLDMNPGLPQSTVSADIIGTSPVHVGLVGYLSGDVDGSYAGASGAIDLDTSQPSYFQMLVDNSNGALNLTQFGIY